MSARSARTRGARFREERPEGLTQPTLGFFVGELQLGADFVGHDGSISPPMVNAHAALTCPDRAADSAARFFDLVGTAGLLLRHIRLGAGSRRPGSIRMDPAVEAGNVS